MPARIDIDAETYATYYATAAEEAEPLHGFSFRGEVLDAAALMAQAGHLLEVCQEGRPPHMEASGHIIVVSPEISAALQKANNGCIDLDRELWLAQQRVYSSAPGSGIFETWRGATPHISSPTVKEGHNYHMGQILELIRAGDTESTNKLHNIMRGQGESFADEELETIWEEGYPLFLRIDRRVTFLRSFVRNAHSFVPQVLFSRVWPEVHRIIKDSTRHELEEHLVRNAHMPDVYLAALNISGIQNFLGLPPAPPLVYDEEEPEEEPWD